MRLKTARATLISERKEKRYKTKYKSCITNTLEIYMFENHINRRWYIVREMNPTMRFEAGPAKEVSAIPHFGLSKFLMFTGTGFAQPKPNNIIIAAPNQSMCFIGFRDNLPIIFAVPSPNM